MHTLLDDDAHASHHLRTIFVFDMRVYVTVHVGLHFDLLHPQT